MYMVFCEPEVLSDEQSVFQREYHFSCPFSVYIQPAQYFNYCLICQMFVGFTGVCESMYLYLHGVLFLCRNEVQQLIKPMRLVI